MEAEVRKALIRGIQLGQVGPNAGQQGFQYRELFMNMVAENLFYAGSRDSGYKDETRAYEIVEQGQVIMILEAMKMQNEIQAPISGKIVEINCHSGESIEANMPLVVIEPLK